ncbi:outer membrane beta-barrel protein [Marinobacter salicampi]|uniref:outer membrane beta-barrel protein n=1 Tax=Marinobacter salicampi TaxID=435907 RepID=UPI00140D9281|nr:outer membrane beta-barrel protein [Marinobacter salicampi]
MKKILFSVATSAVLFSGAASADNFQRAVDYLKDDAYVKATIGFADVGLDDSALAVTGTYGKNLPHIHPGVSAEFDLSFSLSDAESTYSHSMGRGKLSASYVALGAYGVYEHGLDDLLANLSIYGRAGLVYTSFDAETSSSYGGYSASNSFSDSSFDLGLGVGGRYQYNEPVSFVVDYTTFDEVDLFSVGARYEF